jgi:SAM-dependent methyltransferase
MLSHAKPDKNRIFIRAVGEELPVKSEAADIVVIKSVLDHCYDPFKVISESRRVLKKGGLILVSLSNRKAYYKPLLKFYLKFGGVSGERFCEGSHQFHFSYHEVKSLMETGGFRIMSSFDLGYFVLPISIQFLIPNRLFHSIIDLADLIGKLIMPHRGGGFILSGQKT